MISSTVRARILNTSTAVAIALASATTFAIQAEAQVTTSAMKGTVTLDGAPIANAKVTITHTPSGTKKILTTNSNGVYNVKGLRVGGPYSVVVVSTSGQGNVKDVFLTLGESTNIKVSLSPNSDSLEEIVVTGSMIAQATRFGMSTNIGEDLRKGIPATSRELYDIVRIDPLVTIDPTNSNAISIAGSNNRFNSVTIDGVKQNDDFGLNNGGFPTQRSPISLEVIDQISVNAAPFDVSYGGFQGGNINVVTKSGTNDFHGSAFFYYRDGSLTGTKIEDREVKQNFNEKIYGGSFGGPIIKDKLFFMLGFEQLKAEEPIDFGPVGGGYATEVNDVSNADILEITRIANDVYGFNPGSFSDLGASLPEEDRKIFAKLDWNINDDHRAAFTYQYNKGNELNPQNGFSSTLGLPSNWYDKKETLNSYALQVFSDWSENFTTEVKVSYKEVETLQESLMGNDFAEMEITTTDGGRVVIGPDEFRHANYLTNETLTAKFAATYYLDNHEISFGAEHENLDVFNLFVNKSLGFYEFDSIADFEAQEASVFRYQNAVTNNSDDAAASFSYSVNSVYLQDTWTVNGDLTIMAGLRYDWYTSSDTPNENAFFMDRYGFSNTETLDGRSLFQPRVAFNYQANDRTVIRGGVGLFGGGNPNVWVSNSFSNDGVTVAAYDNFSGVSGVDGFVIPQEGLDGVAAGNGNVNFVDPNFKIPSTWKINLAVEHDFDLGETMGDGYLVTAEAIISRVKNATTWIDTNIVQTGTAPDGRPIYSDAFPGDSNGYDLMLTNTTEGKSDVFVLSLQKDYTETGISFFGSYTYTNSEDINSGTSSTATSNYGKQAAIDINSLQLATSNYQRKHRIVLSIDYRTEFIQDYESRFGFLFTATSGRPFSYTFDGNSSTFGADSQYFRDRQLFYVPTGADDPLIDGTSYSSELHDLIESSGLAKYRGEIAPRNAFFDDWTKTLDFKFSQEIPGIMDGHKGVFTFDIQNLTNMLNSNWGVVNYTPFHYTQQVADIAIVGNKYVYSDVNTDAGSKSTQTLASLWKIRLGVRYEF
ncbi:MAG: TonB-dependent receptor [Emcibacter sp.]|nr:TonB-dependent receptor [Emcibacter sp.]